MLDHFPETLFNDHNLFDVEFGSDPLNMTQLDDQFLNSEVYPPQTPTQDDQFLNSEVYPPQTPTQGPAAVVPPALRPVTFTELGNQPQMPHAMRNPLFNAANPGTHQQGMDTSGRRSTKRTRGTPARRPLDLDAPAQYVLPSPEGDGPYNLSMPQFPSAPEPIVVDLPEIEPIVEFFADTSDLENFDGAKKLNIRMMLSKCVQEPIQKLSLTAPVVFNNKIVMGANQGNGQQNYLIQLKDSFWNQTTPLGFNPISYYHEVPLPVVAVFWDKTNNPSLVCIMSDGRSTVIQKYHCSRDGRLRTNVDRPFASLNIASVRDTAVFGNQVFLAHNKTLSAATEGGRVDDLYTCENTISSFKYKLGYNPSLTTEQGELLIFDVRTGFRQPAQHIQGQGFQERIFTHEFYTPTNVLMGGEKGKLCEIDLRALGRGPVVTVKDPYVQHIGNIEYNEQSRTFVTYGVSDFSFWKHDQQRAKIWAHSQSSNAAIKGSRTSRVDLHATFAGPNLVISTNNEGGLGIHLHE